MSNEKVLLKTLGISKEDIVQNNNHYKTPFHYAIEIGDTETIGILATKFNIKKSDLWLDGYNEICSIEHIMMMNSKAKKDFCINQFSIFKEDITRAKNRLRHCK